MIRKILLFGLPVLLVLILVYYLLGGFNQIEIQRIQEQNYNLVGKLYEGKYREKILNDHYREMYNYVEDGIIEGKVAVINYRIDKPASDSVKQFFGVLLDGQPASIPDSLTQETIVLDEALRAVIQSHPLVMPNPDKVIEQLQSQAQQEGVSLKGYSIEQYVGDEEIWVDIPLQK